MRVSIIQTETETFKSQSQFWYRDLDWETPYGWDWDKDVTGGLFYKIEVNFSPMKMAKMASSSQGVFLFATSCGWTQLWKTSCKKIVEVNLHIE